MMNVLCWEYVDDMMKNSGHHKMKKPFLLYTQLHVFWSGNSNNVVCLHHRAFLTHWILCAHWMPFDLSLPPFAYVPPWLKFVFPSSIFASFIHTFLCFLMDLKIARVFDFCWICVMGANKKRFAHFTLLIQQEIVLVRLQTFLQETLQLLLVD